MTHPRCDAPLSQDIPPQEQNRKWFCSHLLSRELELQELYDLPQGELDLVMAETAEQGNHAACSIIRGFDAGTG